MIIFVYLKYLSDKMIILSIMLRSYAIYRLPHPLQDGGGPRLWLSGRPVRPAGRVGIFLFGQQPRSALAMATKKRVVANRDF